MSTIYDISINSDLQTWLENGFYNIIDGARTSADKTLSVINPSTEEELPTVPDIEHTLLNQAVNAARRAFPGWSTLPFRERKDLRGCSDISSSSKKKSRWIVLSNP